MTPRASLLLQGSDEEVVEKLYLALLGRFPDEGGRLHYLARLSGGPGAREAALQEILDSEEARGRGTTLPPDRPGTAEEASLAHLALQVAALREELAALRARPEGAGPEIHGEMVALRLELEALRAELRESVGPQP
ncbi:DUF4214 domain-containing protein [Sabulicella glaciei]|uniref:DUF4214 domain-containing protein n=1 Tax=Sabulicella glaciei TaxID=2984948 RepID=A0ABT3P0J8_9PROT|nr:DUF4214 domain-containing protein [Roseococcus sp. MDT2-1-1]MCW8087937.1 DUF4214 domain-containing protein [Roseococcus sp. MDT2-1-1]